MKNITIILITVAVILGITGCSEGDAEFSTSSSRIDVRACTEPMSDWVNVYTNDQVEATENNTSVMFDHDQDNNKKVCKKSGAAVVVRG